MSYSPDYTKSLAFSHTSTIQNNKDEEDRLQRQENQQDVEFVKQIIKEINRDHINNISINNEFKTLIYDRNKAPAVTACLTDFIKRNQQ